MSDVKLGEVIRDPQKRDAIHIAVAPVIADEELKPGQHVGFTESQNMVRVGSQSRHIGIVDPFLKHAVYEGDQFWMFLYPNTVTGMRHEWEHPDFKPHHTPDPDAEKWLCDFATDLGLSLEVLIDAAWQFIKHGEDHCLSFDTPDMVWDSRVEFWKHFESYTGEKVSGLKKDEMFFRCSC